MILDHARISWGMHELLKASLGPTIPYHSMPCGRQPLKRPYGHIRGSQGQVKRGCLNSYYVPPWILRAIRASSVSLVSREPLPAFGMNRRRQQNQSGIGNKSMT
jgi:hypothetical protein